MIVFLNFAPISFMGGAEKWMLDMAEFVQKFDKTKIIDVSPSIANIYGQLILKRKFKNNLHNHPKYTFNNITSLHVSHFIPLSKNWLKIRNNLKQADIIYIRCELLELFICFYFGGFSIFNKIVSGLHMSIYYENPAGIVQHLHNLIYTSFIFKFLLKHSAKVHVINKRDFTFLLSKFKLNNVVYLPNGTKMEEAVTFKATNKEKLHIIFVGELSKRKGIDTILEVIDMSPKNFIYHIVGRGPLETQIQHAANKNDNCHYYGYVTDKELRSLYRSSDVLFFPSRAEAFGLVMIEALAQGLVIVNSTEVTLDLPSNLEYTASTRKPSEFIELLQQIQLRKEKQTMNKNESVQYCFNHFSTDKIYPKFLTNILNISS